MIDTLIQEPRQIATQELFKELYISTFPRVAAFVQQMQGTFDDAKDIFQDALVIYYEKVIEHKLEIQVSEQSYILGIVKHLWIRKFKRDAKRVSLSDLEKTIELEDDYFPTVRENQLLKILEKTGKKCLDILRAFYYQQLNMKQMAHLFGFKSERSATVQKYKCLEKVRDEVKKNAISYEEFFE